jgi:hypothetical protein
MIFNVIIIAIIIISQTPNQSGPLSPSYHLPHPDGRYYPSIIVPRFRHCTTMHLTFNFLSPTHNSPLTPNRPLQYPLPSYVPQPLLQTPQTMSLTHGHLRSLADHIVIGSSTLLSDNPRLLPYHIDNGLVPVVNRSCRRG